MPNLIPVYHRGGQKACGRIAVFVRRFHPLTRQIPHDNVVKLDGTAPQSGELPICGSCRRILRRMDDWSYEPTQAVQPDNGKSLILLTDATHVTAPGEMYVEAPRA